MDATLVIYTMGNVTACATNMHLTAATADPRNANVSKCLN
jgi:hypothetical protein